ncbi:MAG: hypothetical protein HY917_03765 [Candidatus Diapherotrites archaeon]|nr:hypothetical protein [Candidatus Diapherotrites archaeon]
MPSTHAERTGEKPALSPLETELKKRLELPPEKLTLEYMQAMGVKLRTPQERMEMEKNIRKAEFPVLLLGDNEEPGKPGSFLQGLQTEVALEYGFRCALGSNIHLLQKGKFEGEIEQEMLDNPEFPKLIILVSGKGFGTLREASHIRLTPNTDRTLFFFDHHGDYDGLILLASDKKFPVEFKYPIPYTGEKELRAKILFGILHCFYRYYRFKRPGNGSGENIKNH